jgi:hypothetical protein
MLLTQLSVTICDSGLAQHGDPHAHFRPMPQDNELYVLAESHHRIAKERSMRRRKLKWLRGSLASLRRVVRAQGLHQPSKP